MVLSPRRLPKPTKSAGDLRNEFVIRLKGKVNLRPKGTINPKMPTGEIEILAQELEILNSSNNPPFEINDNLELGEEIRLKHRYLDLRRPGCWAIFS